MYLIWRTAFITTKANYLINIISLQQSCVWHQFYLSLVWTLVSELWDKKKGNQSISNKQQRSHVWWPYMIFAVLEEPCTKVFNGGETFRVVRAQYLICTNTPYEIYLNSIWKNGEVYLKQISSLPKCLLSAWVPLTSSCLKSVSAPTSGFIKPFKRSKDQIRRSDRIRR